MSGGFKDAFISTPMQKAPGQCDAQLVRDSDAGAIRKIHPPFDAMADRPAVDTFSNIRDGVGSARQRDEATTQIQYTG